MKDMETKSWRDTERSVTLTNEQWITLSCYLVLTTNYRKGEREAWERLATEKNKDGTPVFQNAASNAKYYEELEQKLDAIIKTIDG